MRHLTLVLFVLASGCGNSATTAPGNPANPNTNPAPLEPSPAGQVSAPKGLAIAFGAPRLIATSALGSRAVVVGAVYAATALSGAQGTGRIVSTGTLRVVGEQATYAAQPTDRLVVLMGSQRHEFVLKNAQGNASAADATAWLLSPHVLTYHHSIQGEAEGDFDMRYDGNSFTVKIDGKATFDGCPTEIHLQATGATGGTRDLHGHELQTRYEMAGTLRGEGFEVKVQEAHTMTSVSAQSLSTLPSMRGSASRIATTLGSTLVSGGHTFRFENVQAQGDFKEKGGRTVNQESTTSGTLTCDGAAFGECAMVGGVPVVRSQHAVLPLVMR